MASTSQLAQSKYRQDIDGLRAIAVLAVVAFHAFPSWLKGGFVGVDIFFVISGYLISTIILENLERGTFSLKSFYARRIKRIFPALLMVLIVAYATGFFLLLAGEFQQLGKHIAASAGFISNFVFWSESGYFDTLAETKPLLHLWSLSVEEQFYLVWPLLLCGVVKGGRPLLITASIAVASFGLSIDAMHRDPVGAFFLPQNRVWELLVGAVLAQGMRLDRQLVDPNRFLSREVQSVAGLLLITLSIAITPREQFPGWWALLPTVGAALVIHAGPDALLNRTFLSQPALVWVGLISYPLYLWHWPLLSFARIALGETPPLLYRAMAVSAAIVLSWMTYKLLERPIRFGRPTAVKVTVLTFVMVLVGFFGHNCYRRNGLDFRYIVRHNLNSGLDGGDAGYSIDQCGVSDPARQQLFPNCKMDSRPGVHIALLGDSKAAALYPGLLRTSTERHRWLFIGGTGKQGATVPVLSDADIYRSWQPLAREAIATITANDEIDTVVLVTATRALFILKSIFSIEDLPDSPNSDVAFDALRRTIDELVKARKKVVIVIDNPTFPDPKDCMIRETMFPWLNGLIGKEGQQRCVLPLARHLSLSAKYRELLLHVQATYPNDVRLFDPTPYLCDVAQGACSPYRNGRLLYGYSDHISDYAAGLVGGELNRFLATKSDMNNPMNH